MQLYPPGMQCFIDAGEMKKNAGASGICPVHAFIHYSLGALLGRDGAGNCCYPGGCLIGARPIDLHLMALNKWGP